MGRKLVSKTRDCVLKAVTSSRRLQLVHQMSHLLQTLAHQHSPSSHTKPERRRTWGEPLHTPCGCSESSYPTTSYSLAETRQRAGANRSSYLYGKAKKQLEKSYGQANS